MPQRLYQRVRVATPHVDLAGLAPTMLAFMRANIAGDAVVFEDQHGRISRPGCIIASPSFSGVTNQDYVHHWVRDAAITAMELAAAPDPDGDGVDRSLCDYVAFSATCQDNLATAGIDFFRACFAIDGTPRDWSDQKDGPALQGLAFRRAWPFLDAAARRTANRVAQRSLEQVVARWEQDENTYGPWEDVSGKSFFGRAAQLRFLEEVRTDTDLGLGPPAGFDTALDGLRHALDEHWQPELRLYSSILDGHVADPTQTDAGLYDPNSDVVMACIYGAIPATDPRLLATAAQIRRAYVAGGSAAYPINAADRGKDIGPLIGRYPSDRYDGNTADGRTDERHPWAVCTANLAQLYYRLAAAFAHGRGATHDKLTEPFFDDLALDEATVRRGGQPVVGALRTAGDRMLRAVLHHSDHFRLSEQYDAVSGFEKSVQDLTWSYAAYLSAVRERAQLPGGPARG